MFFSDCIHSLWMPVGGEFDDYIVNPKQSGYQVPPLHFFLLTSISFYSVILCVVSID
jgi:hypothetical protein